MEVEVLVFGALRERLGWGRRRLAVPAGAVTGDLWGALGLGAAAPAGVRFAMGERWCAAGDPLPDGAQVAVVTPVSGG